MECIACLLSRVDGPGNISLGIAWFLVVEARFENVHKHLPLSPKWSLRQNTLQLKRRKLLESEQSSS